MLAVTPRACASGVRGKWRRQESNLHSLGASEVLSAVELRPRRSANGWSRTTTARGDGVTSRGARPMLSVRGKGDRPDSNRYREDHDLECCRYTTVTRKKAGTTGFEPATTRSTTERSGRAELRPLMRVRGWDSNPRSRAHEAREDSLSSTAHLPGWSRTSGLRFPKPAGWPSPLRAVSSRSKSETLESNQALLEISEPCLHGHLSPAAKLRRQGSNLLLASNSRASCPLDHAGMNGAQRRKERESNPQGFEGPTRFRDGIPRRWQSFPNALQWSRQESNLHRAD
jgi:hypothetical protein